MKKIVSCRQKSRGQRPGQRKERPAIRTLTLIRKTVSPANPPVTLRVVTHPHLVKLLEEQGLLEKAWMEEGRVGLRP